ncbi:hypothetical protein ADK70_31255 [Streptomyces rimosus subsp. pseudoverticillatus]|uniref:hypothetical protein n=1 Tax=Streptomyces rimosus TaxID=1927 RepID=UPI0006B25ED9|nr:hypothetical protein [Streptomyces rimosus]KOT79253.1 hypothetical protein ADK70_31255 [Streptomyces rimosus subsp. pseudoverticillatus]
MANERTHPPVIHVTEITLYAPDGRQVGDKRIRGEIPTLRCDDLIDLHGGTFRIRRAVMKLHPDRPDHGEAAEVTMRYEAVQLNR